MTKHYNKTEEKGKRRELRNNQTFCEKIIWSAIRKNQICDERFLRQYSIDQYVIDFYCPNLKLAIEIDGDDHFVSEEKIEYDKKRQRFLESFGIIFIRYTDDEVFGDTNKVIDKIEREVMELKKKKMDRNG